MITKSYLEHYRVAIRERPFAFEELIDLVERREQFAPLAVTFCEKCGNYATDVKWIRDKAALDKSLSISFFECADCRKKLII
jgi:hypothetical protein